MSGKNCVQFRQYNIACGYNCRRALKISFKSPQHYSYHTGQSQASCMFDLHETTRVLDLHKHIAWDKVVPCKSALRVCLNMYVGQ